MFLWLWWSELVLPVSCFRLNVGCPAGRRGVENKSCLVCLNSRLKIKVDSFRNWVYKLRPQMMVVGFL